MKYSVIFIGLFWGSNAVADPGHLIGVAGHGHWLVAGAIGAAIAAGLWGVITGKRDDDEEKPASDDPQEA